MTAKTLYDKLWTSMSSSHSLMEPRFSILTAISCTK